MQYETIGRSLDNSLYCNLVQLSNGNGYVSSVSLRLFSEWQGDASLYLFIISSDTVYEISYRYAINPQRNTTEWQTIQIPSHTLPVRIGHLLAIGMQENSGHTNQIYAVKLDFGYSAIDINENTTILTVKLDQGIGVAIGFTLMYYGKRIFLFDLCYLYFCGLFSVNDIDETTRCSLKYSTTFYACFYIFQNQYLFIIIKQSIE